MLYRFIPSSSAWEVIIKNNTDEDVWINWEKAGFIINGKASGVSLSPFTADTFPAEIIRNDDVLNRTITASALITEEKVKKIYSRKNLKKGRKTSVTIVLPVIIGSRPQFFHMFNFIVTQAN